MPRVLMVAPEAAPFAKAGGLADVLGSLPPALAALGEEVAVVLPRYRVVDLRGSERIWHAMPVTAGPHSYYVAIDQVIERGVRYLFVDCPPLYERAGIYGERGEDYPDNHLRYSVLNLAAVGIARDIFRPDVFHGHDWPAGLLGLYLRETFSGDPTFFGARYALTIHNVGYQGNFSPALLSDIGLDAGLLHPEGMEFWGRMGFLKAGIVWADAITTVSPTYAREIQTPEYGYGLDGLLRRRAEITTGILNGADYEEWNPETDSYIAAKYSARDLSGKRLARKALLEEFDLPAGQAGPVIGIVSRLVDQKGFDLLGPITAELAAEDCALIALGSGEERVEQMFLDLARSDPGHFAVQIGYDNALAHRIVAGADMLLMPSRYEPCGLTQMYALRYGTVPIVRATGGLDDTVNDTTGFKFKNHNPEELLEAIRAALAAWKDQTGWRACVQRGMGEDFSWTASATRYQKLYRSLMLQSSH